MSAALVDYRVEHGIAIEPYSVTGERLSPEAHEAHLAEVLPQPADIALLAELTKTSDWLAPKKAMGLA